MNGSWNADSRNGANEMRIGGQPQDCVGDGLDSSVGHCRANELEISAMAPSQTSRTCHPGVKRTYLVSHLPPVTLYDGSQYKEEFMSNPNQEKRTSNSRAASRARVVSKAARTNLVRVVSSRAGRTSPVNRVVSNADLKSKARQSRAFPFGSLFQPSGSFRFLIDHAFGDLC